MNPITTAPLTLDTLPDGCRVWIFAAHRPFATDEMESFSAMMTRVVGKWSAKYPGMRGCHMVVDDRFLVVGAEEHMTKLSGCSADAMLRMFIGLGAETGMQLVDRMVVHYRDDDGAVQSATRAEFAGLANSGAVNADTLVFDTTVTSSEAWRAGKFETPMKNTWLAQAFLN